jgi:hypothetical protein
MIVILIIKLVKFVVNKIMSPLQPTAQIVLTVSINRSDIKKLDLM